MTMGPAPMIRIELMSVRLGIVGLPSGHKKRRRRTRALRQPRAADFARRRSLSPESPQREGSFSLPAGEGRRDATAPSRGGVVSFMHFHPTRLASDDARRPPQSGEV